jgi:hypothetical protein
VMSKAHGICDISPVWGQNLYHHHLYVRHSALLFPLFEEKTLTKITYFSCFTHPHCIYSRL